MRYQEALRIVRTLIAEAVAQKSDVYYEHKVPALAESAARVFTGKHRTQMKNLENIALNATSMSDILNYVKSQAGKETAAGRLWRNEHFAEQLHDAIWETVRVDAKNVAKNIWKAIEKNKEEAIQVLKEWGYSEQDIGRELRLQFSRQYIQHLAAQFLYNQLKIKEHA